MYRCPWKPEEGVASSGVGVAISEFPDTGAGTELVPLQEQQSKDSCLRHV